MSNVLINIGFPNPTTELACKQITLMLESCGASVRSKTLVDMIVEDLNWCDILIDIRPYNGFSKFSKELKKTGRMYIVFFDDDVLGVGNKHIGRDYNFRKCIQIADAVWSANPELLHCYAEQFNVPRTILTDTVVKPEEILAPDKINALVRFVYAAGINHEEPFERYVEPALNKIVKKYGKVLSLTFISVKPKVSDYLKEKIEVNYLKSMPLEEYNEFMRKNRYDVGFAPLEDNIFSNRKYFNKFFEYSKVGIVGIYSNCKPFTYIIKNGENGILADNAVEEWYKAIENVIVNPDKILEIVGSSQKTLKKNYNLEVISKNLSRQLPEILEEHRSDRGAILKCKDSFTDLICIFFDRIYGYAHFFKENGFLEFIRGAKRHIKKYYLNKNN